MVHQLQKEEFGGRKRKGFKPQQKDSRIYRVKGRLHLMVAVAYQKGQGFAELIRKLSHLRVQRQMANICL